MNHDETAGDIDNGADLRPLSEVELSDRVMWGLVDSAPDGLVMVDDSGRIVLVNHQSEKLFGYDRGELLGQTIEQLLPEQARQVHRAHRTRYRADPRTRPMGAALELEGRRRDGSLFPVEISLSPLDGDKANLLVIASVRDISDRIAAEALDIEIRHSLDIVEDGVFMFDSVTLRFRYINQGAIDQVGYERDELLEMTPIHLKPEFTEAAFREMLAPVLNDEIPSVHFTTVHRRKDGTDRPVEIVLQCPPPAFGTNRRSCVALVRDIGERLEAEADLAAAQEQTAVLEERERMARDMHDTVIQELFATGMALQATASGTDDRQAAERVLDAVESIDGAISQLRGAIFGLRTQSQPGEGVRGSVLSVARSAADALGFEPTLRFDGLVDTLSKTVVDHLLPTAREALSNVARHACATEVEVSVTLAGDEVTLTVVDDGIGISGAAGGRATGHGLRNMRERALALGGDCEVAQRDGGGTQVLWRIPHHPHDHADEI